MGNLVVPPGGFAGFSQMTASSRRALSGIGRAAVRRQGGKKRRRKAKSAAPKRRASSGGRKPKFGSPAWHKKYKTGKYKK